MKRTGGWQRAAAACAASVALVLQGCGREGEPTAAPAAGLVPSSGQVTIPAPAPTDVDAYAAARFLEQASFGPTPQAIAEVRRLGFEGWIDAQLALPASTLNAPGFVIDFDFNNPAESEVSRAFFPRRFWDLVAGARDQLRLRTSWALYNYLVMANGDPYATIVYFNLLQTHGFGRYGDLLEAITLNPGMGVFLNNNQNTASALNENYGRELMQLFSVGLVLLNDDGTVRRDAGGATIQTYTQQDVVAATRALTGWENAWVPNLPNSNWANYGVPMRPRTWPADAHDTGAKAVLGRTIPANQTIHQDLESLIAILVEHPNAGPFVATRLIQHLVTSDPPPAYVARVAAVFRSTGGDLGQVVKAILLDPEARRGDDPKRASNGFGRLKEPVLHHANLLRGLGCRFAVLERNSTVRPLGTWTQSPFQAPNVFGYFPPNHRAPGSLLLAPEQKLLNSAEINRRLGNLSWELEAPARFTDAGCEVDLFVQALRRSDDAFLDLVSQRFFRGSLPAPLRDGAKNLLQNHLQGRDAAGKLGPVLQVLLSTPSAGVVR
jgi:uncharacterized protein (DUF1800 family)